MGPVDESLPSFKVGAHEPKRALTLWCTRTKPINTEPPFFLSKKEEAELKITENPDKWVKMRNH